MELGCLLHCINTGKTDNINDEKVLQLESRLFEFNTGAYIIKQKKNMTIDVNETLLPSVSSYSGITNDWLKNYSEKITDKELCEYLTKLFVTMSKHTVYLIGWNIRKTILDIVSKDYKKITGRPLPMKNLKLIDVQRLTALTIPVEKIGNYTLNSSYLFCINDINQFYKDNENKKLENYCSECNNEIYYILKTMMDLNMLETLWDVFEFLNKPHMIEKMPFGKYENKPIKWIFKNDMGYIQWLRKEKTFNSLDSDLRYTINELVNNIDAM